MIFISVVWGMFDAFVAIFLLLSYLTFTKSSYALSGFTFGLSLVKLYTIVLLPLYVIRLFGKWRALLEFLGLRSDAYSGGLLLVGEPSVHLERSCHFSGRASDGWSESV